MAISEEILPPLNTNIIVTIPYLKSHSNSPGASDLMAFVIQHRRWIIMMTSSNENIFRVIGPLCGDFTGCQWIPFTKVSDAELWCFLWLRLNKLLSKHSGRRWFEMQWRSIWCHCNDGLLSEVTLYDAAPEWCAAIESILHTQDIVVKWKNYSSIPKLQRLYRLSLGMDKQSHLIICNECYNLSMAGL